ncbi:fatty acid desaturase [Labrenzia sp. VG12]|uniref:fatty acid desaturase n=1 Tax=Labrenzia sp. VG12 TaxID=2021862 RepID=UPI000B8C335D|nr:fatty acid desaturase [Labrenzia sp. VG12]ASP32043.1 fatty acid desaturase [Labrenzia sp. VG12]
MTKCSIEPGQQQYNRAWTTVLARYRQPSPMRSAREIAITVLCFVALWTAAVVTILHVGWWGLVFTIPTAGFLVRLFILQHDCGHGTLFAHRSLNNWIGRLIGVFTWAPYDYWRRTHAVHHASAGNLDRRGIGDIDTLTVREYRKLSRWARVRYRLYRHPLIMFGLGPAWLFICQYRLPIGLMRAGTQPWLSTIATNIGIALPVAAMIWLIGLGPFLAVQVPVTLMAATIGVWLFYVQHQFEETHWEEQDNWVFQQAALHGSSYYVLPRPIQWITGNIGIHHVHHLAAGIPFYRLPEVLQDFPELQSVNRITFLESLNCVKFVLWDESRKRLITFRDEKATRATAAMGDEKAH